MNPIEQQFFNDLEKKLWTAADKLRSTPNLVCTKQTMATMFKSTNQPGFAQTTIAPGERRIWLPTSEST